MRGLFAEGDAGLPGMQEVGHRPREQSGSSVRAVYAAVLGLVPERIGDEDTFTSLGGDSMSYIVTSTRLEPILGGLPANWQTLSVAELSKQVEARSSAPMAVAQSAKCGEVTDDRNWTSWFRLCRVETNVLLRAIAIVLIVGGHIGVMDIRGGAHLLLVIAGLNYARFQLSSPSRERRWRHGLASWCRVLVPSAIWLALVVTIGTEYGWAVLFGTNLFGPDGVSPEWRYWYVESFIAVFGIVIALMAVPLAHRAERRDPFRWAMTLVVVGLAARFLFAADSGPATIYTPAVVAWLFFVGWALAVAMTPGQRWLALAALGVGLIDYFDDYWRAAVVVVGVLALVFAARVRLPRFLVPTVASLASASLFIYLTHWQVYPPLTAWPWFSLLVALIAGVVAERSWRILSARSAAWWARHATTRTERDAASDTVPVQARRPAKVAG